MKANGVHCQVWIAITETIASRGSPSQFLLPSPALMAKKVDDAEFRRQHECAPDHADDGRRQHHRQDGDEPEPALAALHVHDQQRQREPDDDLQTTVDPV